MREIRPLKDKDIEAYVTVQMNAYPGIQAARERFAQRARLIQNDPIISLFGLFDSGKLLGAMRLYDFQMNLFGRKVLTGGVGGVAVDLAHKKEKVAFDLFRFFHSHYRQKGASLTALYPFRPDFYTKMGYGYGRVMNQYRVKTSTLPKGKAKDQVSLLANSAADRQAFTACYKRYAAATNGLFDLFPSLLDNIFSSQNIKVAAYREGADIRGYLVFNFEPSPGSSFLNNEIVVRHIVYESPAALAQLMAFLHSQADQVETITIHTPEEDFHLLLPDPRNDAGLFSPLVYHGANVQGLGIMYRVIDIPGLFQALAERDFGGQSGRLKLVVIDSFYPENSGEWVLSVVQGQVELLAPQAEHDVLLKLNVAEFSSLILGITEFQTLLRYGLVELSQPNYAEVLQKLFFTERKPICMTPF